MHIYMLKLDGNNRPRTCDFCDYLINRIVDYCIPPSEIRKAKEKDAEYNTTQYTATLFRKAERLFTDLGNTGEVGELALSVLTQSFLHMPQVLCKMVLKTNSEVHYHGADGVYGKYDTETQKYCLYWGEAKIYADVRQALSSCFDSIKTLLTEEGVDGTRKERDMDLFRTNLDFDNPHLEKAIIEYLDPENAHYNMLEYRGVCLVGYNEESYPKDFSRVEDEIFTCIRDKVDGFKQSIQSRLKSRIPLVHVVVVGIVEACDHHGQAYARSIPPAVRIILGPHELAEIKKPSKALSSGLQVSAVRGKQSAEGIAHRLRFVPRVISQRMKSELCSVIDSLLRQQYDGGQLRGKVRIIRRKSDVHHRAEFRRDLPLVYFVVVADVQFDKPSGIVVNDLIKVASIHCAYPPVYRHEMCQGNF